MSPTTRSLTSALLFSCWIVPLFAGVSLGGWIHLALVASLIAFPWRSAKASSEPTDPSE